MRYKNIHEVKKTIAFLLITFFSVSGLTAQETNGSYTLDRLIGEALENNYDIRVSNTGFDISQQRNTIGNAGMLPTLMWESGFNNSFNDRYGNDNQTGTLQNGVRLNWVLFNGFSAHVRKDRLETLEELSGGNLALVVENTIQAVVLGYYRTLFEEERLSLLREVMQLSEDRLQYVEDRVSLGASTSYDALQARSSWLTDKAALLEQEVAVLTSVRELKYLTGMEKNENLTVSGDLSFEASEFSLDQLLGLIETNNQNIRNQYLNLSLLEKQRVLEQRSRYPRLSTNAGATQNNQPDALNPGNDLPGASEGYLSYYANFSLSFTLFDGDRINRNIQIARMEEAIGRTNLEEMKHRLQNRLLNLYDTYEVHRELVEVGKENMETNRVNMELSEERFKAGAINSFNFRDVQLSYLQTSLNYYRSVLNLVATHTDLVRITGGIVGEYE
jgi:outer membrane protein